MAVYMRYSLLALVIGFFLDLILGDPHTSWHPVCLIGKLISFLEKCLRRIFKAEKGCRCIKEIYAGLILWIAVIAVSALVPFAILTFSYGISSYVGVAVEAVLCYFMLAAKSLKDESMKVYHALRNGGLDEGRRAVSMIVGRDTERLDEKGVIKAAVETIAENLSDGVIAPMFYMAIGGAVLMYVYKAVNTMDSMLGYKNDNYFYFGKAAAKADDVFNFIPSRLSALCMIFAAFVIRLDWKNAAKVFKRDRFNHASPNSAQTEAVAAGALDVMLAGDAYYFGELYHKETIGDDLRQVEISDIRTMNRLMYVSALSALIIFGGVKLCICMAAMFMAM
jgi:adenosylcobinamide-phosphate synthase